MKNENALYAAQDPATGDDPMCECADCGDRHRQSEVLPFRDFWSRIQPGETMPAGDCPKCGAFSFLVEP